MQELHEIASTKIKTMIEDGTVEKMIEEQLTKTVQSVVQDSLKDWSPFGKALSEKVKEAVKLDLNRVELPEYSKFIVETVEGLYTKVLQENSLAHLKECLESDLAMSNEVQKSSHIMEQIRKHWEESAQENNGEIEVVADYTHDHGEAIYLAIKHPSYDWYSLRVRFYKFDRDTHYHIGYITQNNTRIDNTIDGLTEASGLARYFYKLYAAQTLLDLDEDDFYTICTHDY